MKKALWLPLCLFLALALAACGGQADEAALARMQTEIYQLQAEVYQLTQERDNLIDAVEEQGDEITYLQDSLARAERQYRNSGNRNRWLQSIIDLQNSIAWDGRQDEMMASFRDQLDWVADFLGEGDLSWIFDENYMNFIIQGNSVIVGPRSTFGFELQYRGNSRWAMTSYWNGIISGPGPLDAGRSWWRSDQARQFDENFTMRVYRFSDWNIYEYREVEIEYQDWQEQVRRLVGAADLWYEGTRLIVDLSPAAAVPFNHGSTGSAVRGFSLINSLATLPNVTEIELLVGGQRGMSTEHFHFGVFRVDP